MSTTQKPRKMDPKIEDAADEALHSTKAPSTNGEQAFSWPELLSRHESVLSSHLEFLDSVRGHLETDEAVRTLSGMVEKTNRLMAQFKVVQRQMNKTNPFSEMSTSAPRARRSRSASPRPNDTRRLEEARIRSRSPIAQPEAGPAPTTTSRRRRAGRSVLGEDEDDRNAVPESMGTEDISEEVERRLRIKEERRKKDYNYIKPAKRKRDSLTSNESKSPRGRAVQPRTKKPRVRYTTEGDHLKGDGAGHGAKRRGSGHSNPEDRRGPKRARREPTVTT
ncbi:hypothetical protein PHISP_05980 [Aspergillus sp. HF37]|nr:hypothetical protein PHISP_05980 [Aspergillus sp. HF37]